MVSITVYDLDSMLFDELLEKACKTKKATAKKATTPVIIMIVFMPNEQFEPLHCSHSSICSQIFWLTIKPT